MLEARRTEMAEALAVGGATRSAALREVAATVDRLIYYAGWADKYEQTLGNVNPVAAPYFNFTVTEPMGIVGIIAPDAAPLLGLISLVAPVITSGNTTVALASELMVSTGRMSSRSSLMPVIIRACRPPTSTFPRTRTNGSASTIPTRSAPGCST